MQTSTNALKTRELDDATVNNHNPSCLLVLCFSVGQPFSKQLYITRIASSGRTCLSDVTCIPHIECKPSESLSVLIPSKTLHTPKTNQNENL